MGALASLPITPARTFGGCETSPSIPSPATGACLAVGRVCAGRSLPHHRATRSYQGHEEPHPVDDLASRVHRRRRSREGALPGLPRSTPPASILASIRRPCSLSPASRGEVPFGAFIAAVMTAALSASMGLPPPGGWTGPGRPMRGRPRGRARRGPWPRPRCVCGWPRSAGLRRRHHDCTRHTFITQTQDDASIMRWATHAPPKTATPAASGLGSARSSASCGWAPTTKPPRPVMTGAV